MNLVGDRIQVVNHLQRARRLQSLEEKCRRKKIVETTNEMQRKRKCRKAVGKNAEIEDERD